VAGSRCSTAAGPLLHREPEHPSEGGGNLGGGDAAFPAFQAIDIAGVDAGKSAEIGLGQMARMQFTFHHDALKDSPAERRQHYRPT